MNAIILKCPQPSKFRFGKVGLDVNSSLSRTEHILHSDTLFSAIINIAVNIFPDDIEEIVAWFKEGEATISSAFFCFEKEDGSFVYFLPKPSCYELFNYDADKRKQIRKITFLSKSVWEQGLLPDVWQKWAGETLEELEDGRAYLLDGKFALTKEDLTDLFSPNEQKNKEAHTVFLDNIRPRITDQIRRPDNNYYFQSELYLTQHERFKTHWYFLLKANEERLSKLETILKVLIDTGIGGRVSSGCGQLLDVEIHQFEFNLPNEHDNYTASISLLSPKSDLETKQLLTYNIVTRGGRRVSGGYEEPNEELILNTDNNYVPNILKRLKMVEEGAIVNKSIEGDVKDISPTLGESKFLRYGKAFKIPIHQSIMSYENYYKD